MTTPTERLKDHPLGLLAYLDYHLQKVIGGYNEGILPRSILDATIDDAAKTIADFRSRTLHQEEDYTLFCEVGVESALGQKAAAE